MKVTISQRSIYHKYAEVEIEIPDGMECNDVHEYLTDNEELYIDKMDEALNNADIKFGFGLGFGMVWKDDESEWRFDIMEEGKPTYGGHL